MTVTRGREHRASSRRPRRFSRSETTLTLRRRRLTVLLRAMRSERLARRPLRLATFLRTTAVSLTRVAWRATTRTRSLLVRSAFAWVPVLRRTDSAAFPVGLLAASATDGNGDMSTAAAMAPARRPRLRPRLTPNFAPPLPLPSYQR